MECGLRGKIKHHLHNAVIDLIRFQIWECFEQRFFFDGRIRPKDKYSVEGHLSEIVHQLGPAPREFLARSEHSSKYFNENG